MSYEFFSEDESKGKREMDACDPAGYLFDERTDQKERGKHCFGQENITESTIWEGHIQLCFCRYL